MNNELKARLLQCPIAVVLPTIKESVCSLTGETVQCMIVRFRGDHKQLAFWLSAEITTALVLGDEI